LEVSAKVDAITFCSDIDDEQGWIEASSDEEMLF